MAATGLFCQVVKSEVDPSRILPFACSNVFPLSQKNQ